MRNRSCRERLEAHNTRQREKWTVGGRRRGKGDDEFYDPAYPEPPPAQLQRFLSADQSAAAGAAFGGMPAVPMPHHISQVHM